MSYDECHRVGGMTAYNWLADPKRLAFQYARYLFVAKMVAGMRKVLEVGCADGQGARIVRQHVSFLDAIDADWRSIGEARKLMADAWAVHFSVHDIMQGGLSGYDAVYCLDLFEHIDDDKTLLRHLRACAPVAIIGTPSKESQVYASPISRREHVNCVSQEELRAKMLKHWKNVFSFGMNDTTLHAGFGPMCHYLFAIGAS